MSDANLSIPKELRDFAERSVEEARKAFEGFVSTAQKAAGVVENAASSAQTNAKSMGAQALGYAEQNINAAFDLAQKLVKAKDAQEAFALQSAFVRDQFEALKAQGEKLAAAVKAPTKK